MNFCSTCGQPVRRGIPDGDHFPRFICSSCKTVHYENPKVVVGCIPVRKGKILLCKRAIEPSMNRWTLPAGFMELNESAERGAMREALEEARAVVKILHLHAIYSIPHVGQLYLMFLADLLNDDVQPTPESSEVRLFEKEHIPWDDIAFPSIRFTLETYLRSAGQPPSMAWIGNET